MYQASIEKYTLNFIKPSGTSRGVLTTKDSWFIRVWKSENPAFKGIGEASIIKTLSPDWSDDYPFIIQKVADNINDYVPNLHEELVNYPSIIFAIETALKDLENGGKGLLFSSPFTNKKAPIKINGLIWMGDEAYMLEQIRTKIKDGFDCIKLKIGAIDFQKELDVLRFIRSHYSEKEIELRVDANGAFSPNEAMEKLNALAEFDIHSIEQPIRQGQIAEMRDLCASTPIPIALDEELIGVTQLSDKIQLLTDIRPQYIILKPSLIGGFKGSDEWVQAAEDLGINWWITSALESNVGLNAIAQYTFTKNNSLPQGLGTGQLFTNNTKSSLRIDAGRLYFE